MKRLADELRAAFLRASGNQDGWEAVADKAQEMIDAAVSAAMPRVGTDDFEFRRFHRLLQRYDTANTESEFQSARAEIFAFVGQRARALRGVKAGVAS